MNHQYPTTKYNLPFHIFFLFFSVAYALSAFSQTTIKIQGKAFDAHTKEPLSFINIYLSGTTLGTTTDIDGRYVLEIKSKVPGKDSIVASSVGYGKLKIKISSAAVQIINFELERSSVDIAEVTVMAGENPAEIILRNIIKNKLKNNKEKLSNYQYEVYNKMEIDIDNLNRQAIEKNKLFRPFAFILDNIDSSTEEKPFLPVFLTESLSDYYYRKNPKGTREIIKASRISGVKDPTISQFIGSMYQNINIYDNWIPILDKSFVSPVSDYGLTYYKYFLLDSADINGKWCYKINFKPRRKQENTFFGDFWVNDTSWAIKKISMQMTKDANINFIEKLSVFQEFMPTDGKELTDSSGMWMLIKDKLIIDFVSAKKVIGIPGKNRDSSLATMGLIGRKTTSYKNIAVNDSQIEKHFIQPEDIIVLDSADEKNEDYWNKVRHDTLSKNEKAVYAIVDTMKKIPIFKSYIKAITFIVSGYKSIGKIDFGPYFNILSKNSVEGWRLRLGITTNDKFSQRLLLKSFVAYGFDDQFWKYGAGIDYIASKKPWQKTGVSYKNDFNLASEHLDELGQDNLLASFFRRKIRSKQVLIEEKKYYFERDWKLGWSNRFVIANRIISPAFDFKFNIGDKIINSVNATEVSLNTRFAYREKYVQAGYDRINISGKFPVVQFQYVMGMKNILESDFEYHKLFFNLYDYIQVNPFGLFYYNLSGGKIFGKLPYLLLENHKGNEDFYYNKYAFNTMKYYEFVSDQYVSLTLTQYFGGLFLNKIPLMRKLKWRELVSARGVLGDMSSENKAVNSLVDIKVPSPIPFVEAGGGIENIFKVFRIDALWRLTYLTNPDNHSEKIPKFGIYGSVQIEF